MHYLIRLRKILLSNYLYLFLIVIGTIYILINANLKTNSKYKINDKLIFGVLTNYSVDGGKLSLEITGKEKIVGTYYFETKSEKKNFINNVEIGDKLKIIGNLKLPSQK